MSIIVTEKGVLRFCNYHANMRETAMSNANHLRYNSTKFFGRCARNVHRRELSASADHRTNCGLNTDEADGTLAACGTV